MIIDVYIDEDEMLNDLAVKFIKFACKEYGILPRKVSVDEHADLPYSDRWWEEEAFSDAIPLVEKFSKTIKPKY